MLLTFVRANGVEYRDSAVRKTSAHDIHEVSEVLPADVLQHAYGDDGVELSADVAVILKPNVDRKVLALGCGVGELLLFDRHGYTHHVAAVLLRRVERESAKAATQIDNAHPGLQVRLLAD